MTKDIDQKTGLDVTGKEMRSDYYVYAWHRPDGRVFYIGKGRASRDITDKPHNSIFKRIVGKIRAAGEEPTVVRVSCGMIERDAFALEVSLIAKYGRLNNRTGILANLTDGGEGTSGYVHSHENRRKISNAGMGRVLSDDARTRIGAANSETQRMSGPRKGDYKGVTFDALRGLYCASIQIGGKKKNLGRYKTKEDAAKSVDAAAYSLWGENCYLNFPGDSGSARPKKRGKKEAAHSSGPVTGKYKGVHIDKKSGKAMACIRIDGATRHLGTYATEEDAARAYDLAAVRAWGLGNCYLNFPDKISELAPKSEARSSSIRMAGPRRGLYKGVYLDKRSGMHVASINNGKSRRFLGCYTCISDAAKAYDRAAVAAWGLGNCYLNFPAHQAANDNEMCALHQSDLSDLYSDGCSTRHKEFSKGGT